MYFGIFRGEKCCHKLYNGNTKSPPKFHCEKCDYSCSKKRDFNKHLSTLKHKKATLSTEKSSHHICSNCNKEYKDRTGLWKHKKSAQKYTYKKFKVIVKLI